MRKSTEGLGANKIILSEKSHKLSVRSVKFEVSIRHAGRDLCRQLNKEAGVKMEKLGVHTHVWVVT